VITKKPAPVFETFSLKPYFFKESIFAARTRLDPELVVARDLDLSKVRNLLDPEKVEAIRGLLVAHYETFLSSYVCLAAVNYMNGAYSVPLQALPPLFEDFPSAKKVGPAIIELKFIASTSKSSKKGSQEIRFMKRHNYLEFLVRMALEYDQSKTNALLLKNLEQVLEQLRPLERRCHPQLWREQRYWSADTNFMLNYYEEFITKLFYKYSEFKSISLPQFIRIFKDARLVTRWAEFELEACFFISKNVEMDEDNKLISMDFSEFNEGLARAAECFSLTPPYPRNLKVENEFFPLYIKLEALVLKLAETHPELGGELNTKGALLPVYKYFEEEINREVEKITVPVTTIRDHTGERKSLTDISCTRILNLDCYLQVRLSSLIERKKQDEEMELQKYYSNDLEFKYTE
jgi:hypothetical protein